MSRAAAGGFAYAPFAHGMWGFSNTSSSSQKYSGLGGSSTAPGGNPNNFGYPPTPPKDSGTPDGQQINEVDNTSNGYHHMNNNNTLVASGGATPGPAGASGVPETKPSAEHLMSSISSLSAYAGLPSSASRKLPEGTNSSQQYSTSSSAAEAAVAAQANSMFYYPTSSDLAMYGSAAAGNYGNRTLQSSRPKSKNRSNAGKKLVKCGGGF